ncbi:hypothetical protein OG389_16930 [Streptomyces sp. NBC_00435]|uniref:hypothetical protein n=1 Tax=Streptomyces sp. NBC_00435 TaxID=2903649 RepID=UPI002E1F01DC
MRVRSLRLLLVPAAVGAVLLTGCSGEPKNAAPDTHVSFKPVPTATSVEPTRSGTGVIQWYQSGGAELLGNLISAARIAQGSHEADKAYIDLGDLSARLEAARGYTVAYIPDQKTHETWTKARQHLSSGLATVLNTSGLGVVQADPSKAAQTTAEGWAEIGQGIEGLRETDNQLRALGCVPTKDPWK